MSTEGYQIVDWHGMTDTMRQRLLDIGCKALMVSDPNRDNEEREVLFWTGTCGEFVDAFDGDVMTKKGFNYIAVSQLGHFRQC